MNGSTATGRGRKPQAPERSAIRVAQTVVWCSVQGPFFLISSFPVAKNVAARLGDTQRECGDDWSRMARSNVAHVGRGGPGVNPIARAPRFSSEHQLLHPGFFADCSQNHPLDREKTLFLFSVTDAQDAFRGVPSGSPKKNGRPGSLRRHASPREERFANSSKSAQFALQSVGVVPMTEAQANPGHPAELARSLASSHRCSG